MFIGGTKKTARHSDVFRGSKITTFTNECHLGGAFPSNLSSQSAPLVERDWKGMLHVDRELNNVSSPVGFKTFAASFNTDRFESESDSNQLCAIKIKFISVYIPVDTADPWKLEVTPGQSTSHVQYL